MYLPLSYLNIWGVVGKWAFEGLETRAALVSQEPTLEASPDPYAFTRDVYLQRRDYKAQIAPDEVDEDEEDLFDEFLEEDF
jgi:phospholipid-binding lipoprotein MlaA